MPAKFRRHIHNVAVLVEDVPPDQEPPSPGKRRRLLLGSFQGVPLTKRSSFLWVAEPSYIVLYQKNIEAICANDAEVREQIRSTVIHEFGHYFGMTEEQLKDI